MLADLDPVMLARIQFAVTIGFHIIFPAFTIGLSAWIAVLEVMWLRTGRTHYEQLARFWTKAFAVSFAMGVVSGIVMSYQFGTNWSRFSVVTGNVIGPLLGYEVLTAFFLEATFLGVMLFGWNRVPRGLHVFSSIMVAIGTLISTFWIISANSWMHAPTGYRMEDGIVIPADWFAIVFNPTFPLRLLHMTFAAYLTTAVIVLAVGAGYMLNNTHGAKARTMMRMGLGMLLFLAPAQLFIGDQHGLQTLEYQPAKIAAMEARWDGGEPGDLVLFAIPDEKAELNRYEISIPYAASLILTHSWDGTFPGLKDFAVEDRPPVLLPFYMFRVMVGIGLWFIALAAWGGVLWWRGALFDTRLYHHAAYWSWPLGFIAILAGWITTEVGRQPWTVTGVLRTADSVSPVTVGAVATSLAAIVVIYTVVFGMGIFYIYRLLKRGPEEREDEPQEDGVPSRPLAAAHGREGSR